MAKPLTAISVAKARAGTDRREIPDPGCRGLYLVVQPSGVKSWAARYRAYRRSVKLTLGPALVGARAESADAPQLGAPMSLAAARELCARVLREAKAGRDPAADRRQQREQQRAAESDTLRAVSEEFLRRHPQLRTLNQRRADLELFYPSLGQLPIDQVRRGQIFRELDRISDQRGPVRADRALGAIKRLLAWHSERSDYLSVLGRGGRRTSTKERARSRVLDDSELRRVWQTAERFGLFGDLLRFLLVTATRRNEAAGLRRSELSPDGKTWILPAARCKNKHDVTIPLSVAAQRVIAARPKLAGGDHVFSVTGARPFSNFAHAKAAFDEACGVSDWTIHDLRRSARTLLARCSIAVDVAEQCLGHSLGGIRGTYDRHNYTDEKRHAFEELAALVERIVRPPSNTVVPIRARARPGRRK
jgi:integrase